MLNDLFQTYKKIIILVLVLICAAIFWFYGCHRQQGTAVQTDQWEKTALKDSDGYGYNFGTEYLKGNVVFGTCGYLVSDKTLPVTLSIDCEEDSFTGTLKITLPGEDGKGIAYQSAITCKKGVTSRVVLSVPELGNASYFCFEILDQFGAVEFSKIVIGETEQADGGGEELAGTLCVGVLAEDADVFSYLQGMPVEVGEETKSLCLVPFGTKDFPTDSRMLEALSGMLIDSFDTSTLSKMQKNALKKWVENGGCLVVGTGVEAEKVLSGLTKYLGITAESSISTSLRFTGEDANSDSVNLALSNFGLSETNQWTISNCSVPVSCYSKNYGRGIVEILKFSLSDETLLQWTGRDTVIQKLFAQFAAQKEGSCDESEIGLWYVKKGLYAFMNSQMPNTFYYGVFFLLYFVALILVSYYFLRRIKKREYIWIAVPLISCLFTLCLVIRARGVASGEGSSFSALRIMDADNLQDDVYFLYQNTEGESCSVDLSADIQSVTPLDYGYRMDAVDSISAQGVSQDYTVNNTKNGFDIAFEDTVPGTSRLLKLSYETPKKQADVFTAQITGEYTSFYGTVKNISSYDFQRVVVIRGNQYKVLENMKSGETAKIHAEDVSCWSGYEEENEVFGNSDETTVVGNLMEYIQQQYIVSNEDANKVILVGITNDNNYRLFSDKNTLQNHVSLLVSRFSLEEDAESSLFKIVNINRSCLEDADKNTALAEDILEKNKTEVTYRFDSRKIAWVLARNRDSFQGKIYAYNYTTGELEPVLNQKDSSMHCETLEPYLSDLNEMKLTFCMESGKEYGGAPVLSLMMKEFSD